MSEINLPVLGKTKSGYVWAGVAIVAGIVGVAYWRRRSSSSTSSASTASTSSGQIDPITGDIAGSAQDQADLAAQGYGQGGANGFYSDGYGYGYGGVPGMPGPSSPNPNTGPGTFTANAYWLAWCEQNIQGYSATDLQNALVAYLSGSKLNAQQYAIYQTAVAIGGQPPQPPPTPIPPTSPPPPGPTPGGGGPPPSGQVKGLHFTNMGSTSAALLWEPVTAASGYGIRVLEHGRLIESETVTQAAATITGLKSKTDYTFEITAQPGTGHSTITGVTH